MSLVVRFREIIASFLFQHQINKRVKNVSGEEDALRKSISKVGTQETKKEFLGI